MVQASLSSFLYVLIPMTHYDCLSVGRKSNALPRIVPVKIQLSTPSNSIDFYVEDLVISFYWV